MNLIIRIDDDSFIESYLSIVSLGVIECIKKNILTYDETMKLIYFPGMIDKLEELMPNLGEAIHLGTELEDVINIVPHAIEKSIDEITKINYNSIKLKNDDKQHVFYSLEAEGISI